MKKIHVLLTFDYEIFGNGTGDIMGCLVNPTWNIANLLRKYNLRATFFVDVCLLWALQDSYNRNTIKKLGYDPLEQVEDQLSALLSEGHDIQLHAHPQFIGSSYNRSCFDVNLDFWRIVDLPHEHDHGGPTIKRIISEGKSTLSDLCRKTSPDYRLVAFRAGGLCSRPEKLLLRTLREYEIGFDFSASYNFKCNSWPGIVDYTDVFLEPDPIPVGETYNDKRPSSDLVLFPVYGALYHHYRSEFFTRLWRKIRNDNSRWAWKKTRPAGANGDTAIPGYHPEPPRRPTMLNKLKPLTINFYIENSVYDMVWCAKDAVRRLKRQGRDVYMVGIGHPKAMGDLSQIDLFIQWIQSRRDREVFSFPVVRNLIDHQLVDIRS